MKHCSWLPSLVRVQYLHEWFRYPLVRVFKRHLPQLATFLLRCSRLSFPPVRVQYLHECQFRIRLLVGFFSDIFGHSCRDFCYVVRGSRFLLFGFSICTSAILQSACWSGFSATFSATAAVISATLFEALVFSCSGSVSAQVPYCNPLVGRGFQRHFRPQLAYTELAGLYSQVVEPFRWPSRWHMHHARLDSVMVRVATTYNVSRKADVLSSAESARANHLQKWDGWISTILAVLNTFVLKECLVQDVCRSYAPNAWQLLEEYLGTRFLLLSQRYSGSGRLFLRTWSFLMLSQVHLKPQVTNDQEIHLHSVKLHLAIENCERYVISISVHANLRDCILLRICLRSKSIHALISLVIFIS